MTEIGPLTSAMEALAAAVGAGMLLGGFAVGGTGLVRGLSRRTLDRQVLASGYAGGAFALLLAALETMVV